MLMTRRAELNWSGFSCVYLSVVVEALQYVPAPVSVLVVLGESVHVEEGFHCFWSQQVVSVCGLEENGEHVIHIKVNIKDICLTGQPHRKVFSHE